MGNQSHSCDDSARLSGQQLASRSYEKEQRLHMPRMGMQERDAQPMNSNPEFNRAYEAPSRVPLLLLSAPIGAYHHWRKTHERFEP